MSAMDKWGARFRRDSATAQPAGPPPAIATSSLYCKKRSDYSRRGSSASAGTVRYGSGHGPDNGVYLQARIAVRPCRHQPADVVVNPFFAVVQAFSLKTHLHGGAITERATQRELPVRAADGSAQHG